MAKTCTNYKQIDRLVELGFDLSTTDMFCTEDGGASNFPICSSDGEKHYREAWSLGALLGLLPEVIKSEGKYGWSFYSLHIMKEQVEYGCWTERGTWSVMISSPQGELVDAAFHLLCWLVDNGYLNPRDKEGKAI